MKKIETIWHYLLYSATEKQEFQHTQANLADLFGYSTSTVNLALNKPSAIGAIRKSGKFFVVADVQKLLYLWATIRNLSKDIIYQTHSSLPTNELEGLIPPTGIYGLYSAARLIIGEPPADYSSLYFYDELLNLPIIKSRYPVSQAGASQIIVLKKPKYLPIPHFTTLPHTFVDLWNVTDWYARDFTSALEAKIHDILS